MRRSRHPSVPGTILVVATATVLLVAGVYAYDRAQEDRIAPGVSVAGVEIGGRSVDEAREIVEEEVAAPLRKAVVVEFAGRRYRLSPNRLEQRADVDEVLDEAVSKTREGGLVERVTRYVRGSAVNVDLELEVSYSEEQVDGFVAELAERINRDPRNASIEPSGDVLTPTPGRPGIELREDLLHQLITAQVESSAAGRAIRPPVDRIRPEITTSELAREYPTFITVDRDAFKLRLFRNLKLAKTYTIAVGAIGYATPAGLYGIETKEVNPTWHVPDSEWTGSLAGQSIPPGPSNPLKARWMGIYDGAGIHGTDDLASLGTAASHGCIRMAIPEVVELFGRVDVGTPVYIE